MNEILLDEKHDGKTTMTMTTMTMKNLTQLSQFSMNPNKNN